MARKKHVVKKVPVYKKKPEPPKPKKFEVKLIVTCSTGNRIKIKATRPQENIEYYIDEKINDIIKNGCWEGSVFYPGQTIVSIQKAIA
jgi:hypothetical protein